MNDLLVSLKLKGLPDFSGLMGQNVLKLFLLLTQHLYLALVVGNVLVDGSNDVLIMR